jgi:hypothetical protein
MQKSDSITELAKALALAQAEMKNPAFDSNNPHFKSKYASLAAVRDAVLPVLSKHGLSVSQFPVAEDGKAGCDTLLIHASGQYISERLLIPCDKQNAHGVGSCITYSRRFSLMGVAGVVGDEDDDGNAAVGSKPVSTSKPILSATITPTDGAWDAVKPERREFVRRIGSDIVDLVDDGRLEDAYVYLYEDNKDADKIDNDEFLAIWAMLQPYSKQRNALKKMREERKQSAKAA